MKNNIIIAIALIALFVLSGATTGYVIEKKISAQMLDTSTLKALSQHCYEINPAYTWSIITESATSTTGVFKCGFRE